MAKGTDYKVEKKQEIIGLDSEGKPTSMYRIVAVSKGGTRFHLDIPEDQLDQAEKLLTAKANRLDAI